LLSPSRLHPQLRATQTMTETLTALPVERRYRLAKGVLSTGTSRTSPPDDDSGEARTRSLIAASNSVE
jgi:hypothetical protein